MDEEPLDRGVYHGIKPSHGHTRRECQKWSIEDYPKREPMHPRHVEWEAHEGLKFDAIDGMLRKGVGRPWSKVYSGIVSYIKADFPQSAWRDVFDRIRYLVELSPMDVGDGQYVQANGHSFYNSLHENFLVHPKTGLLIVAPKKWCDIRFEDVKRTCRWDVRSDQTAYDSGQMFRRIHGVWYGVDLVDLPSGRDWIKKCGHKPWETCRYQCFVGENDWLYQANLYDAVLKTRLSSSLLHELATVHGFRLEGKIVSHAEYTKRVSNALKNHWYGNDVPQLVGHEKYIYASKIWQVSKGDHARFGLPFGKSALKLPNIVR